MDYQGALGRSYGDEHVIEAIKNFVRDEVNKVRAEFHAQLEGVSSLASASKYEMSKLDCIAHYLNLLYEANKAGHAVHDEINAALKQFKEEAGI